MNYVSARVDILSLKWAILKVTCRLLSRFRCAYQTSRGMATLKECKYNRPVLSAEIVVESVGVLNKAHLYRKRGSR